MGQAVQVTLLGQFSVSARGRVVDAWPRPSARRLCELVLVSPGHRVSRDLACEELFPNLEPRAAARALSKALSMARSALAELGADGAALLAADLGHIWASPDVVVDVEARSEALRAGLALPPGQLRDDQLAAALAQDGELLADEPYADWAIRVRDRLRDAAPGGAPGPGQGPGGGSGPSRPRRRAGGLGVLPRPRPRLRGGCGRPHPRLPRPGPAGAGRARFRALPRRAYAARAADLPVARAALRARPRPPAGRATAAPPVPETAQSARRSRRPACGRIGWIAASAAATDPSASATAPASSAAAGPDPVGRCRPAPPPLPREERRPVSVLFAEVAAPAGLASAVGLETLRELVGGSLAAVIAEVEALGGTVTSVSGRGLQAMFGAPEAHEDDPERAVLAAFRALSATATAAAATEGGTALRIGVEPARRWWAPSAAAPRWSTARSATW